MKIIAFTIALLTCAVFEQSMQVRELNQKQTTINKLVANGVLNSINTDQRANDQLIGATFLLDMLESTGQRMTKEQQLARFAELSQGNSDPYQVEVLKLLNRGANLMGSTAQDNG